MSNRLTSSERRELDRRRAISPVLSTAGTGASIAALGTSLGGMALKGVGQKPKFNSKANMGEWVDRKGVKPGSFRHRASRIGGRMAGATLPMTAVAGAVNAASAMNNARTTKLWNKRDKVYTRLERDGSVFKKSFEAPAMREWRRNRKVINATEGPASTQSLGAALVGAGGAVGAGAGYSAYRYSRSNRKANDLTQMRNKFKPNADRRSKMNSTIRSLRGSAGGHKATAIRRGRVGAGLALAGGGIMAGSTIANRRAKDRQSNQFRVRKSLDVPRQIAGQMLPAPLYNYLKNNSTDARQRQAILARIEREPSLLRDDRFIKMVTGGMIGLTAANILGMGRGASRPGDLFRGVKA